MRNNMKRFTREAKAGEGERKQSGRTSDLAGLTPTSGIMQPQVDPQGGSRWHFQWCSTPDVFVNDEGIILCRACNRSPNVAEAISRKYRQDATLSPAPGNQSVGAYNLWWPPSVPYTKNNGDAVSNNKGTTSKDSNTTGPPRTQHYPAYPHRLVSTEFRLLCLSATSDPDAPLHLTLETHRDERHPEYEAVSYTWGGENDDASLCCPVYVGPYWDLLLQSNNCSAMLRFLRPFESHERRLIWVDALCINQDDSSEKVVQVAKMGFIYRSSRRVVVYLGEDVATIAPGQYPVRRRLEDAILPQTATSVRTDNQDLVVGSTQVNLGRILQRRYFSRVWVVQELLLASQVTIQVGDLELRLDAATSESIIQQYPDYVWSDSPAAWLQLACRGKLSGFNIIQLMALTATSKASDPRDKIYGLVGLLDKGSDRQPLLPDYSLSSIQLGIGVAAHCLLDLKFCEVLRMNPRAPPNSGMPSWIPDMLKLSSTGSWVTGVIGTAEAADRRAAIGKRFYSSRKNILNSYSGFEDVSVENRARSDFALFQLSVEKKSWCEEWTWNGPPPEKVEHRSDNISVDYDGPLVRDLLPWHDNATVSTSTAALSINLTELCPIYSSPIKIFSLDGVAAYRIHPRNQPPQYDPNTPVPSYMYLLSEQALDEVIRPGDVIFILDTAEYPPLFPILRPKTSPVGSFRLVACAHDAFFEFSRSSVPRAAMPGRADQQFLYLADLQRSLKNVGEVVLEELAGLLPSRTELARATGPTITALLPGVDDTEGILAVMQAHFDEGGQSGVDPLQIYVALIHPRFHPLLVRTDDCIVEFDELKLRASPSDQATLRSYAQSRPGKATWSWRRTNDPPGTSQHHDPPPSEDIVLWTDRRSLMSYVTHLKEFRALRKLSSSFYASGKKTETEILALVRNEDCQFIACPKWPIRLIEEFCISGSTYRVTIY